MAGNGSGGAAAIPRNPNFYREIGRSGSRSRGNKTVLHSFEWISRIKSKQDDELAEFMHRTADGSMQFGTH